MNKFTFVTEILFASFCIDNCIWLQDLEELDPDFIMAKQVEQLEKEKKELQERLKNQEKKVQSSKGAKLCLYNTYDSGCELCIHIYDIWVFKMLTKESKCTINQRSS